MRWSRLKKLVEEIWVDNLDLVIHCSAYRSSNGEIGRYWIKQDSEVIWSVPDNIDQAVASGVNDGAASDITILLREYLDTPRDELLTRNFPRDRWGIIDIMRAADRRIGKQRLLVLKSAGLCDAAQRIVELRL